MQKHVDLHPILMNQLKSLDLSNGLQGIDSKKWPLLLDKISKYYYDAEQQQYLLEQAMIISSKEMRDLNEKLEEAQNIANLGYWFYDRNNDQILWSTQTYNIFGVDPHTEVPKFNLLMQHIHADDRENLEALINRAFAEGIEYEIEFRITTFTDNKLRWVYAKGRTNPKDIGNVNQDVRSISGIIVDITEKKLTEIEMQNLHQKFLTTARFAGMSEVATAILHNVGNILNSVNISIAMIKEYIANNNLDKLVRIGQMLKDNSANERYLTDDAKGKLVPDYILSLSETLNNDFKEITVEINNLDDHLSHIKDIVVMQKDISGISGVLEKISLSDIADLAINMCFSDIDTKNIIINRNYQFIDAVLVDKSKLLQIVVNLIRNAKDSILASPNTPRSITVTINKSTHTPDNVELTIKDNGIGIEPDKQVQIFSFGYTTKIKGHGFGLHSCSISINEMGGDLQVHSDGIGKGAAFTIILPIGSLR